MGISRQVFFCAAALLAAVLAAHAADSGELVSEGTVLYEAGDVEGARTAFAAALDQDPDNAGAAYMMGLTYLDHGAPDTAAGWFERAVKLAPEVSRYHQHLGEALARALGDAGMLTKMRRAGAVRKAFERAVALDPDNLEARLGLIAFYLEAPAISGGGRDKAEAEARAVAARDALAGHRAWFDIYLHDDDHAAAMAEVDAIIGLDPSDSKARLMRGVLLTEQKEFRQALAYFNAWIEKSPDAMQAVYQVGRISALSGLAPEEGEAALITYLQHAPAPGEPPAAWAHYRLGQVYLHMNREDAARMSFRKALELEPAHRQAREALAALGN